METEKLSAIIPDVSLNLGIRRGKLGPGESHNAIGQGRLALVVCKEVESAYARVDDILHCSYRGK
jgi:hypothetical protein